jgi:PBSX family phage terminase large subunit
MTYKKTGQKILFMGVDDKSKIKSIKLPFGYVGIVWYEELDQFAGMHEIRNVNQSLLRGGSEYWCFYSFNPPKSRDNWVNVEQLTDDTDRLVDHSTYLQVPAAWLGDQFILEAEKLKEQREDLYDHEYMGEVTGTGGDVFANVTEMTITGDMIDEFDCIRNGIDFGFSTDPFCYVKLAYDSKRESIYIYREVYGTRMTNKKSYNLVKDDIGTQYVYADSAEPKSIEELCELGLRCLPVKKGPDSRDYAIKWLSDRAHIYIDKKRCPNTYREFVSYEFDQDKDGNFISQYPKHNDHSIDAVRYALKKDMNGSKFSFD